MVNVQIPKIASGWSISRICDSLRSICKSDDIIIAVKYFKTGGILLEAISLSYPTFQSLLKALPVYQTINLGHSIPFVMSKGIILPRFFQLIY